MKTTSRDIWAIPPGGFTAKPKRNWIRPTIAITLVLALGIGGGAIYASMKQSTAVSTQDALAQFRAGSSEGSDSDTQETTPDEGSNGGDGGAAKPAKSRSGDADQGASGTAAAANPAQTSEQAAAPDSSGSEQAATRDRSGSQAASGPRVPQEGVYTWNVEGIERGPGVERRLPRRSHRIVTHQGGDRWEEHHIFSEQKELWFNLGTADDGVYLRSARNKVTMGPVTIDRTVTFDPFLYVSRFPMQKGKTWDGRWDGRTQGTYTGAVIDHGSLTIDGKTIEVYVTEVEMQLRGEVEGRVLTRSWVAPEYSMVVKQYQESDVKSGPGSYYSEWEGEVASLTPQR